MIRYLTGVSNRTIKAIAHQRAIGLLCQPASRYVSQIKDWPFWAADNGCFAKGDRFELDAYLGWLRANQDKASNCLFATAPDVVGNMAATWARCAGVLERIRDLGFPAALVAQNGLAVLPTGELMIHGDDRLPSTSMGVAIPWDAFDVLFIGGDDRFKLGLVRQHALVGEAKRHGKHVHMGRVNSYRRLQQAEWFGCDTADGTFLSFAGREGQDVGVARLEAWLDQLFPVHRAEA